VSADANIGDLADERYGRLHWYRPEELDESQRAYYDRLTAGPRDHAGIVDPQGRLLGAFNARLLDPEVGTAIEQLGAKLRFSTTALTARQRELTILEVARFERSEFEWAAHERAGRTAGLTDTELAGILTGAPLSTLDAREALTRRVAQTLLRVADLDDEIFAAAASGLGLPALFDVISLVGHYRHTALALRAWRVPAEVTDRVRAAFGSGPADQEERS
jgi:4-carboxymuconolactone decarboxylase